jgi:(heptosyl)LPS beta-1,4-glucosyltransferase
MAPKVPVTVVIPVLNEGHQIEECVRQCLWADEILVADGGSTDATVAKARAAGATVLEGTGPGTGRQRNQAFAKARNQWIFSLDCDERFTPELVEEIRAVVAAPGHATYRVRRRNIWEGREQTRGGWARDWVDRLHHRDHPWVEARPHDHLKPSSDVGSFTGALIHYPYRDLTHHLQKMVRYGELGAIDLWNAGKRASFLTILVNPAWRFFKGYFLGGGILEGRYGLVRCGLGAYTAFIKYAYLWSFERTRK